MKKEDKINNLGDVAEKTGKFFGEQAVAFPDNAVVYGNAMLAAVKIIDYEFQKLRRKKKPNSKTNSKQVKD